MFEIIVYFTASGDNFSPNAFERLTNINFTRKNEPGDLGEFGKYKGTPVPFGRAMLKMGGETQEIITTVLNIIDGKIDKLKALGADLIIFHLAINYSKQCNLSFEPMLLRKISDLGIPLTITCIEVEDVHKDSELDQINL